MRIFNTYPELNAALELPAMSPGAYRFAEQYGKAGFVCAQCGAVKVFPTGRIGTGYGVQHGQMFCYTCCAQNDREALAKRPAKFFAYLAGDGKRVTSWPGEDLARVTHLGYSRSGWHGSKIYRFHARDTSGQWWQGIGPGPGMYCTLRPLKHAPSYARSWGKCHA